MPVCDLLVRSVDRDAAVWPSARDFELRLPQVMRRVERIRLIWTRFEEPLDGASPAAIHLNGDLAERLEGGAFALVARDGPPESGGTAGGDVRFQTARPTLTSLRVRTEGGGGGLAMGLRVWSGAF